MSEPPSSPPAEELAWYKEQYVRYKDDYEDLVQQLDDLKDSLANTEAGTAELEMELDRLHKSDLKQKEQIESLTFDVKEWKRKCEAGTKQATKTQGELEKEITALREDKRQLQLQLRDTEVANDDFERQARNNTSSLEDLESKYNITIERAVMLEGTIEIGEQERERLRVENQRLRESLADTKIEAEILQDKLSKHEGREEARAERDSRACASSRALQSQLETLKARQTDGKAKMDMLESMSLFQQTIEGHEKRQADLSREGEMLAEMIAFYRNKTDEEDKSDKAGQTSEKQTVMPGGIDRQSQRVAHILEALIQLHRDRQRDSQIEAGALSDALRRQQLGVGSKRLRRDVHSPVSFASSPLITTPTDTKSVSTADTISELQDPPSPPMSDASTPLPRAALQAPGSAMRRSRLPSMSGDGLTPKLPPFVSSLSSSICTSTSRPPLKKAPPSGSRSKTQRLPASSTVRSLTAQMQRLEAHVYSVRSRLPAPAITPPREPPGTSDILSTVTIRSRKRAGTSATSSTVNDDSTPSHGGKADFRSSISSSTASRAHVPKPSTSGVSRLSFGPQPNRNPTGTDALSRPSSRASVSSYARPPSRVDGHGRSKIAPPRPASRTSETSGTSGTSGRTLLLRPRSSMRGSVHGYSNSLSYSTAELDEEGYSAYVRTPSRQSTYNKLEVGIPTPHGLPIPGARRKSAACITSHGIRRNSGIPPSLPPGLAKPVNPEESY